ncbi:hypothetical protein HPB52_021969 [Rhipicephalus sanguineus]|uniref:Uncharacterized protein n=1 Tax=Rhipicephalus sanguineus TaxID=34632 RepID=A0A9D4PKA9_RHISA|nr:hypothetical protein HPB52_021969 [Rhipicephalus sanguineus]
MEALFERRNQVRKAVTQAIASIESLLHVDRPSVSQCRGVARPSPAENCQGASGHGNARAWKNTWNDAWNSASKGASNSPEKDVSNSARYRDRSAPASTPGQPPGTTPETAAGSRLNNGPIAPDTVVHVWKPQHKEELASVTSAGYKALLSTCWYLDYISYGPDWKKYYACDPHDFSG